jgi:hypothetical protein
MGLGHLVPLLFSIFLDPMAFLTTVGAGVSTAHLSGLYLARVLLSSLVLAIVCVPTT